MLSRSPLRLLIGDGTSRQVSESGPQSAGSPRTVALQVAGLLGLVTVIAGLLGRQALESVDVIASGATERGYGGRILRSRLPTLAPCLPPVGNRARVMLLRHPGRTYQVVLKGGFTTSASDMDYGLRHKGQEVFVAYVFEAVLRRTVESNDGRRVVELVEFESLRTVKLLTEVKDLAVDLGDPTAPILQGIGRGVRRMPVPVSAAVVSRSILQADAEAVAAGAAGKAMMAVDPLEGKAVRITYVDGSGVEAIEPVGCRLTSADCRYLFQTAVLADGYFLPDPAASHGSTRVDGRQLVGFLDPTLRPIPRGAATITPGRDPPRGDRSRVSLSVESCHLALGQAEDVIRLRGSFAPTGTLQYNLRSGLVEAADLEGPLQLHLRAEDHLLARVELKTTLSICYRCTIR